ncbi:hypothetical protein DM02DRAFT_621196 [Periconia macrospinosa]|uniref:Uncharacterized protein n=1 Tax=Periconia macrospinosa TaxID=97972 RepID=A0A2V1EE19_9PLEO|nr:hypothetical protein DM02DRAFT_621196 [Periconia macrospinosa]
MKALISALSGTPSDKDLDKAPDILRGRPTFAPQSKSEIRDLLKPALSTPCTCDHCASMDYIDHWSLCDSKKHLFEDLQIPPRRRPLFRDDRRPFNALYLARATVKYFARRVDRLEASQQTAIEYLQTMFGDEAFIEALDMDDCRNVDQGLMLEIVKNLARAFFFDEVKIDQFRWKEGYSRLVEKKGVWMFTLHPTAFDTEVPSSKATQRIGTILHELTRMFLLMNACQTCTWASKDNVNTLGRGRAWHIIAKAIEEIGSGLLHLEHIDLRRQASLLVDVQDGLDHPSLHDLRIYAFEYLVTVKHEVEDRLPAKYEPEDLLGADLEDMLTLKTARDDDD